MVIPLGYSQKLPDVLPELLPDPQLKHSCSQNHGWSLVHNSSLAPPVPPLPLVLLKAL